MGYSGQDGHGVMFWTDFRTTHASLRSGRCAKYSHRLLQVLTQGTSRSNRMMFRTDLRTTHASLRSGRCAVCEYLEYPV